VRISCERERTQRGAGERVRRRADDQQQQRVAAQNRIERRAHCGFEAGPALGRVERGCDDRAVVAFDEQIRDDRQTADDGREDRQIRER
jgi:hypothetical protein